MWCNPRIFHRAKFIEKKILRKDNYGQDLIDKSFLIDPLDTNNALNVMTCSQFPLCRNIFYQLPAMNQHFLFSITLMCTYFYLFFQILKHYQP